MYYLIAKLLVNVCVACMHVNGLICHHNYWLAHEATTLLLFVPTLEGNTSSCWAALECCTNAALMLRFCCTVMLHE
jgi:hypothetical protein